MLGPFGASPWSGTITPGLMLHGSWPVGARPGGQDIPALPKTARAVGELEQSDGAPLLPGGETLRPR